MVNKEWWDTVRWMCRLNGCNLLSCLVISLKLLQKLKLHKNQRKKKLSKQKVLYFINNEECCFFCSLGFKILKLYIIPFYTLMILYSKIRIVFTEKNGICDFHLAIDFLCGERKIHFYDGSESKIITVNIYSPIPKRKLSCYIVVNFHCLLTFSCFCCCCCWFCLFIYLSLF